MIKRKGQIIRLDTVNTTLAIKADTAEYVYYGKRLSSASDFQVYATGMRKLVSSPGKNNYLDYGVVLENADGGFAADF